MFAFPIAILAIENEEDRLFMQQLYEENKRLMASQAFQVLRDRQYVEDVISESCLALIKKIELLTHMPCHVRRSYIVSTIRNTAITHIRKQARLQARSVGDPDVIFDTVAADNEQIDARILFGEQVEEVKRAISFLTEREMQVMEMKYLQEMSTSEIAQAMMIEENSVRKTLIRARSHVLKIIVEEGRS